MQFSIFIGGDDGGQSLSGGYDPGVVQNIVSTNLFDDASTWVQNPNFKKEKLDVESSLAPKFNRCGKHVHLPCLSIVETVFVRRAHEAPPLPYELSILRAVEVQNPIQPLCAANTGTVKARWKQWTALRCTGAGEKFDIDGKVTEVLSKAVAKPWFTLCLNKDNL